MSAGAIDVDPAVRALLREAARWRLLGLLFECPNDRWRSDLTALTSEADDAELSAAVKAAEAATEGQYHSVFGPGGPAPPREASHRQTIELGSLMSELTGYYSAFGYHPRIVEAPDHVAVEAGFVAYLRFKEAYAMAAGDTERALSASRAAERFLADHLAVSAGPLAVLLADSGIDYLVLASALVASRAGSRPGPIRLPVLNAVTDEGNEFSCDTGS